LTLQIKKSRATVFIIIDCRENLNSVIIADNKVNRMGQYKFLKMSGYSKEEIIGRAPGELLGPESNPEVILYLRNQIKKASLLIVRSLIIQKREILGAYSRTGPMTKG
jgi:hypothetical protein